MTRYQVKLIGDDDLPDDYDWALLNSPEDIVLFVTESMVCGALLEEVWEAKLGAWPSRSRGG